MRRIVLDRQIRIYLFLNVTLQPIIMDWSTLYARVGFVLHVNWHLLYLIPLIRAGPGRYHDVVSRLSTGLTRLRAGSSGLCGFTCERLV